MGRLVLGLDIGITSVGYGVIDIDNNTFVDYGVRLFKENTAKANEKRRGFRGNRRLIRRRRNRKQDLLKTLKSYGIDTSKISYDRNPYVLRCKGLNEQLTDEELIQVLLHIAKHRGSSLETVEENETSDDEKTKSILAKNSQLIAQGKYVCEIQLQRLQEDNEVRGINNNFKTVDYINEAKEILKHQRLSEEQNEKIIHIIERRRAYYEGPGSEKSPTQYGRYSLVDGEIVYCDLIEKMRGKCSVYPDELRAPKNSYTAELFNLLNDLNNLSINGEKLTQEQKEEVICFVNEKGNITPKQLVKLLGVEEKDVKGFRIDKNEKNLLTEFKGYKIFKKIFEKCGQKDLLSDKRIIDEITEVLTQTKGLEERKELISKINEQLSEELVDQLAHITTITQYHSLSFKAMRQLNEEMIQSPKNQMQLLHEMELFHVNRKSKKGQKNIVSDEEAILSPIAKRAHRETFKVVNALRKQYGEFDSIVIETAREKNSDEQRKNISKRQKFYEEQNKKVNKILDGKEVNGKTKLKIRLYEEQGGKTAYTLQPIDLNLLINDPTAYEIDHIIPISISLDDSFSNKVLVSRKENQDKTNTTPVKAFLDGKFTGNCTLEQYKAYVQSNKNLNYKKKANLLYDKDITKYSTIKEFINRNLVDTSYACRSVMNTLQHYFEDNDIPTKVHTVKGSVTHIFRNKIHLDKDRDANYFHHAIDALIIASVKKQGILNTYLAKYDLNKLYDEETGEIFEVKGEYLDPKYIQFISGLKNIYEESVKYSHGIMKREDLAYAPIKVSHKIDTKPNRSIADQTLYSTRNVDGNEKVIGRVKNIYDSKEKAAIKLINNIVNDKTDIYIMAQKDPQTFEKIKEIVLNRFEQYKTSKEHYSYSAKKGYELKGESPLTTYFNENGKITKYSKKNNGPEITSMKFYNETLGNHLDITKNYDVNNKKVILKQISPYRTDFYISSNGKYNFVTIRYKDVFYEGRKGKYVINKDWYENEKAKKKIDSTWKFVCSMHRDELIGIVKKENQKYMTFQEEWPQFHDGIHYEVVKFTATSNDETGRIEVKPIECYENKQIMPSVGTFIKVQKFATDVLGNRYIVKDNILKLEFE